MGAALALAAGCDGGGPDLGGTGTAQGPSRAARGRPAEPAPRLARFIDRPAPDSASVEAGLSAVRAALDLQSEGRPEAADDSLAAAARHLSPAADWIGLGRARAAATAGDTARVRRILAGGHLSPSRRHAAAVRVTALDSAGDDAGAARAARRWSDSARSGGERGRALLRAGRLFLAAADSSAAREALLRSARTEHAGRPGLEAVRALVELGRLAPGEELLVGRTLADRGLWREALAHLRAYLSASPAGGRRRDTVRLEVARALLASGRYSDAVEAAEALAGEHRGSPLAARALLVEGRARLRQGGPADGTAVLRELFRAHPGGAAAGEALAELASRAQEAGDLREARRLWTRAARNAGTAREAEDRRLRGGTLAYLTGAYDTAAALFRQGGRGALPPELRQRRVYWSALALRAGGEGERAQELLRAALRLGRFGYYGTRAAELLGRPLLPADVPAGPRTSGDLDVELANAVLRVRVAGALGFAGAAGLEAGRLEAYFGRREFGRYALAEALTDGGFPLRGVEVGVRIRQDAERPNLRLLRILYPFPGQEAVRAAARRRGLSPYLLAGLIRQESLFESDIESYAGAVGLMQIMPGTGRDLARQEGVERFRPADLRRPALNLRLGTAYLARLLGRFDGGPAFGLAAYNAGPHRVERWRRRPSARDPDVFLEHIPFGQTRRYVKAVLGGARVYAALYGCGRWEPCVGRPVAVELGRGRSADGPGRRGR